MDTILRHGIIPLSLQDTLLFRKWLLHELLVSVAFTILVALDDFRVVHTLQAALCYHKQARVWWQTRTENNLHISERHAV